MSAQVALAAVEGRTVDGDERYRVGGRKCPVITGVAGVDLVAGAAIDAAGVHERRILCGGIIDTCCNRGAETAAGVTTGAGCIGSRMTKGWSAAMEGCFPCSHFASDQRGVIVAGRAG